MVNARFAKPIDTDLIKKLAETHDAVITVEEGVLQGGFGSMVAAYLDSERIDTRIVNMAFPDRFITHGKSENLLRECGLSSYDVEEKIRECWTDR